FGSELNPDLFPAKNINQVNQWVEVFSRGGGEQQVNETLLRANISALEQVLFIYDNWDGKIPRSNPRYTYKSLLRYLNDPSEENARAVYNIAGDLQDATETTYLTEDVQ